MQETEDIVKRLEIGDNFVAEMRQDGSIAIAHKDGGLHMASLPEATMVATIATLRAEVDKLRAELKLCGKDNCMGRRVKGVTQWVTEQAKDAAVAAVRAEVETWQKLYRRAINEANGLTNYVEDRPELRSAEKRIDRIEQEARAAIDAAKADKEGA